MSLINLSELSESFNNNKTKSNFHLQIFKSLDGDDVDFSTIQIKFFGQKINGDSFTVKWLHEILLLPSLD